MLDPRPVGPLEADRQFALAGDAEIGRPVLVAKGMPADNDRFGPAGDQRGMLRQMIGSRKITPPRILRIVPLGDRHIFFELEFLHPGLVGGDGGAFDAYPHAPDRLRCFNRHHIRGCIPLHDPQIEVQ